MIDLYAVTNSAKEGAPMSLQNGPYQLLISYPVVSVRDNRRGRLVAHSSMPADFESSLHEFADDFFTESGPSR